MSHSTGKIFFSPFEMFRAHWQNTARLNIYFLVLVRHSYPLGLASSLLHHPLLYSNQTSFLSSHINLFLSSPSNRLSLAFSALAGAKKRSECRSVPHREGRGAKGGGERAVLLWLNLPPLSIQNVIEKGWIKTGRSKKRAQIQMQRVLI